MSRWDASSAAPQHAIAVGTHDGSLPLIQGGTEGRRDGAMQRRGPAGRGRLATILLGASLVAGACSGAPAAASGTTTPLASSSAPAAATTVPTESPAAGSSLPDESPTSGSSQPVDAPTGVCAPFAGGAQPPATADVKALVDRLPKTVDGVPVRDPKAYQGMQVFCSGSDDGDQLVQAIAQTFGLDLRTVVMGRFGATVDSYATLVEVIRAPGQDGNAVLPAFAALGAAPDPALATRASVGGKDVGYITDGAGKRYVYVDGDTIWTFTVLTEAQAATIIAVLAGSS